MQRFPAARSRRPRVPTSAYRMFTAALAAEDRGDKLGAESAYRQALELEPSMAAALVNLGNLLFGKGQKEAAREAYESALACDPNLPEARTNLASLLDDLKETDLAISELRSVCTRHPDFATAHYQLGAILSRVGGKTQAREHLARYVVLEPDTEWAAHARAYLEA